MVIRKDDRVSTVLRQDESLVEVFAELSPAFDRLRSPTMRKVMARLVTVEQAATIAGVDADELVARLNEHRGTVPSAAAAGTGGDATPAAVATAPSNADPRPAALAAVAPEDVIEADVRDDLRRGEEPFSRIMSARREVPDGGALCVRAIFEPVPLYAVMEKQGLAHYTEELGPEDWRVWFYEETPEAEADEAAEEAVEDPGGGGTTTGDVAGDVGASADRDDVVVLDVRGLEPPEPMVRTLAALETLPADATLVQINVRVPQFLLPQLDQRGFAYEVREQEPELVRLFIRRAHSASAPTNSDNEG